ncbi:DUF930 domain-containing protein [Ensifer adhaerens]|uniref:DUF930 domain-containing protein n=1 Tax=Ensifer adhaerens TaxID=106592 RepID=UPI001CBBB58B|nr:DUF930 domain-containing protein [Ensifer adhaerens]MBZ7925141.1 DUF930 domain-containing protein [Ensifer adhaerens]UAX97762.1 DUF930 domain-containing protein [Ensifer adhaerens]UAY05080.1 DUF930 domain-containing protein [Ensifer adhaerens]UAY10417.1 DUF930 domain-containing protein [Ensifer adhaerens]
MRLFAKEWWERIGWGAPTSVALHLIIALLLLFDLPLELPKPPKEQTVSVELVPPPEVKQEKKAEQKKAEQKKGEEKKAEQPKPQPQPKLQPKQQPQPKPQPKPPQQLPQTFASAMAKTKQDNKEAELPPAAQSEDKKPEASEQAKAATEPAKVPPKKDETPVKEQKPLPTLAVPAKSPQNATEKPDEKLAATVAEAKPEPKDTKPAEAKRQEQKPPEEKPTTKPADAAAKVELKPVPSKLVEAKKLYAEKAIADPRMKQALLTLPLKARISQLCKSEALEQIRHQRPDTPPQGMVPFGPRGGFISKNRMDASGGAYHSKKVWYDVDFKCLLNEDATEVISFSIAIGGVVPKSAWETRRLGPPPD